MGAAKLRTSPVRAAAVALAMSLGAAVAPAQADDAAPVDAHEGVSVAGSLTAVVQRVGADGSADAARESRANVRGDVTVTLPAGTWGGVDGKFFAHFRAGQGTGVALRPTFTSTPNSTAFDSAAGPDDAYATVAQAWYQLTVPLAVGGLAAESRERLEVTGGKIDPFLFFDQNAAADDETTRFLNNAFVHNPLLDSGGDVGVDRYGFTPGVRLAYVSERATPDSWGASLGVFGSGPGADFTGSPGRQFFIAQLEATRRVFAGQPGTYRLYAWHNGRASDFAGAEQRHAGFGVSIDQRAGDDVTLFTRLGGELQGDVRFDRALTLGAEIGGGAWSRSADAFGIAAGFLRTSSEYRDATADGTLAGYAASGTERIAEMYYRWRIGDRFDVSPDLQWIWRPGGDGSAPAIFVAGVRARVGF